MAMQGIKLSEAQYKALGELQGVAEVAGIIGKIQSEMDKLMTPKGTIISTNKGRYAALEGLKNDIEAYTLSDQVSKSGGPVAVQQQLRTLAQSYGNILYESRRSMKTVSDSATLSEVQKVDGAIRDLLAKNNPSYADINKVYTLNSRLADILNETKKRESSGLGTKRVIEMITTVIGAASTVLAGSVKGGAGIAEGIIGTASMSGLVEMLNSTWWNSLRAVQKNRIADKLMSYDPNKRNQALLILGRQGAKYAEQLGLINGGQGNQSQTR